MTLAPTPPVVSRHALALWFALGLGCGEIPGSDPPDAAAALGDDAASGERDAAAEEACEGVLESGTRHCYILIADEPRPWAGAAERCQSAFDRSDRAHLVTITTATEDALVRELVGGTDAWIGGTDAATEGAWAWVTGEAVTLLQWIAAEPNNAAPEPGEDCMAMKLTIPDGGWNDAVCEHALPFVCERD